MPVVVEPRVNLEKLQELLAEGTEHPNLDFKEDCDLRANHDRVELAKDFGAMSAEGGFIVIGADSTGSLTGALSQERSTLFDEARLRDILKRWVPLPFELLVGRHDVNGNQVVLLYIGPHPEGICVFRAIGQYDLKGKQDVVFREGDVFVRDGTQSRRWQQHDIRRFRERVRASERERWREEVGDEITDLIKRGTRAESLAEGPAAATDWRLDGATLEEVVVEQLRRDDEIPLNRLLERATGEASELVQQGDVENLQTLLDRLACLLALMVRLERTDLFRKALRTFVRIYELSFDQHGSDRNPSPHVTSAQLQLDVLRRIMAVGALAVRLEYWSVLKELVLQSPRGAHIRSGFYTNWVRHGQVQATRANLLIVLDPQGAKKEVGLLSVVQDTIRENACLRPDLPNADGEQLLTSVVSFDFLAMIIVMGFAPGDRDHPYYPNFARYYWNRFEPVLAQLIEDPSIRPHIHPGNDQGLARDIQQILKWAAKEGWAFGGGGPLGDAVVRGFLESYGVDADELD